jgi:hypothetical protein
MRWKYIKAAAPQRSQANATFRVLAHLPARQSNSRASLDPTALGAIDPYFDLCRQFLVHVALKIVSRPSASRPNFG